MAPDYDLSNLPAPQVDTWIHLQVSAIFRQIMADQAKRLRFPLALRDCMIAALTEKPPVRLKRV